MDNWKLVTVAKSRRDGAIEYSTYPTTGNPAEFIIARTAEQRELIEKFPGQINPRGWHLIAWCDITEELALAFDPMIIENS